MTESLEKVMTARLDGSVKKMFDEETKAIKALYAEHKALKEAVSKWYQLRQDGKKSYAKAELEMLRQAGVVPETQEDEADE